MDRSWGQLHLLLGEPAPIGPWQLDRWSLARQSAGDSIGVGWQLLEAADWLLEPVGRSPAVAVLAD